MTQDIFDTGKEIFESLERLRGKREDERMKLANLLELIGHIVKDTVDKLRLGQLPSGKGLQLEMLSEELYFRLAFSLGEIKAKTLAEPIFCTEKIITVTNGKGSLVSLSKTFPLIDPPLDCAKMPVAEMNNSARST